jgi:hypothetical protein
MRSSPDLAHFGDLDSVLSKIGDVQVRDPVRQYFRVLYYVQQIRNVKWFFFALFITLSIEFQISALFPDNAEWRVVFSLIIAVVVLLAIWLVEHCVFVYGGDPADLFETRDEELAIVREIGDMVMGSHPQLRNNGKDLQTNMGALFSIPESNTKTTPPAAAETAASESSSSSSGHRALGPIAAINKSAPRSSIQLPHGRPVSSPAGTVRAGLLHFQSSFAKQQQYRVKDK